MVIEPFHLTHKHTDTRWHEKTLVIPYVVRSSGRLTFFLSILECVNYLFDVARRWGGKVTPLDAESGWNSYSFTGFLKKIHVTVCSSPIFVDLTEDLRWWWWCVVGNVVWSWAVCSRSAHPPGASLLYSADLPSVVVFGGLFNVLSHVPFRISVLTVKTTTK